MQEEALLFYCHKFEIQGTKIKDGKFLIDCYNFEFLKFDFKIQQDKNKKA